MAHGSRTIALSVLLTSPLIMSAALGTTNDVASTLPLLFLNSVSLMLCVLLLWMATRALKSVSGVLFGERVLARVIGFGIATALFPAMVTAPFDAAVGLVKQLASLLLPMATQMSQPSQGSLEAGIVSSPNIALSLTKIIFGFVTWVVAGHIIDAMLERRDLWSSSDNSDATSPWRGLTLVLIMASGIYLILAAISAIPYLRQETISPEAAIEQISKTLDIVAPTEAEFSERFPPTLPDDDPIAALRQRLIPMPRNSLGTAATAPDNQSADKGNIKPVPEAAEIPSHGEAQAVEAARGRMDAGQFLKHLDAARQNVRSKWGRARQDAWRMQDDLRQELEMLFQATVSLLPTTKERLTYIKKLRNHYFQQMTLLGDDLDRCRNSVERADSIFAEGAARSLNVSADTDLSALFSVYGPLQEATVEIDCKLRPAAPLPEPPARGSAWGPLGRMFRWAFESTSLDAVVVIGMLGAGLFGSAVGSIKAAKGGRRTAARTFGGSGPMWQLVWHLVRGFAATVIVYLALKTGVTFAATGDPDPDPYLMLLLCFIGTVFSDDVWDWARKAGGKYWHPGAEGAQGPE